VAKINLPNYEPTDPGEGGSFEVMPKGYYKATIESAETRQSQKGNECINLRMRIINGEYDGNGFFEQLVFTDWDGTGKEPFNLHKARWFIANTGLNATGAIDTEVLARQLKGRRLTVKLDIEIYNEKERNRVVGSHPINWEPEDRAGTKQKASTKPLDLTPEEDFF
jgi:hypothetical protein